VCKNWFIEKKINVDHIIAAGSLNCGADLDGFVNRLFVEVEGLQVLCSICHDKKTAKERENRS
jgi:5-methylcytosine-specific restriction endonuclease McrA